MIIPTKQPEMTTSPPKYEASSEALPAYRPSLEFFGLALVKSEFSTPFSCNEGSRAWKPVLLELNSTQLNFYELDVKKTVHDLIIALYNELNSLHNLIREVNNDYKLHETATNLREVDQVDLFDGDAYGNNNTPEMDIVNPSTVTKIKLNFKSYVSQKLLKNNLSKYYTLFEENNLLFEPVTSEEAYTRVKNKYQGQLISSFTLSNLELGEAPSLNQLISAMYKEENIYDGSATALASLVKYKNVLRLRIEYKQILLQFWSFYAMVHWFRMLTIGRDLSVPLEQRTLSKLKSVPSRYTSRNNALLIATAAASSYRRRNDPLFGEDDDEDDDLGLFGRNACWYGNDADHKPRTLESSGGASSDVNRSMSTLLSSSEGSLNESIFDNERRPSVATTTNSLVLSINVAKNNAYVISINNLKFVSYEKFYTVLEKQYISNCIPDLNSYDRWNGKDLTLSNYKYFVGKGSTVGKGKKKGIFIPYNDFIDHTSSYEKKRIFSGNHIKNQRIGSCHSFRIYQMGLVGVQPEERADVIQCL